ncbi:anti-sigma-K factor RskA [Nonlabens dokdonensis]|jgi:anti-sigma-K factor RskA|uniref:RNA polymerase sigma-70 factor n=2 Tax=Nonlabens dokdonensis TaxID=328515 RepID=L7W9R2_NONDD|nr:anti-sigma factor [Nonlabens dokdonensis]AGC75623.1 RNA polymerase sigma-70 factor [Nonlabens dokdonensis DSW-6]PZX43315.1 anti-sigma-K factor RskA [Nonlabens dokdonensis]
MMEDKNIQDFLDSGLLEQYVIGATEPYQSEEVESFIEKHTEIKFAYDKLQEELQVVSKLYQKQPPENLKSEVLKSIDRSTTPAEAANRKASSFSWLNLAAIFIGLIGIAGFLYVNNQNTTLETQLSTIEEEQSQLLKQVSFATKEMSSLEDEIAYLKSADTDKYILKGNQKAQTLLATAYYNKSTDRGEVEINNLPSLDKDHDYQLWADVDGEMISLAVLKKDSKKILDPTIMANASSLNITIEPAGGNDHATVENLVAAVNLRVQP